MKLVEIIMLEAKLEDEDTIEVFSELGIRIKKLKYNLIALLKALYSTAAKLD